MANFANRLFNFGLYLLFFLLPLQTRYLLFESRIHGQFWEYGSFSLYITEILLLTLVIIKLISIFPLRFNASRVFFAQSAEKSFGLKYNKAFRCSQYIGLFFLIYLTCSYLWSQNQEVSLFYLVRFWELFLLIWLVMSSQPCPSVGGLDYYKILLMLVISVLVQAGGAISQFMLQEVAANKWLGIAAQQPMDLGVAVVATDFQRYLRAYGGLPHPNILAGWLLIGIWSAVFMYQKMQGRLFLKRRLISSVALLLGYAILLSALILTFSRSAWWGFIFGWLALILVLFYKSINKAEKPAVQYLLKWPTVIKLLAISSLVLIFLGVWLAEPLRSRGQVFLGDATVMNRLEIKSISQRWAGLKVSWQLIKKHPLFGSGVGTYTWELSKQFPQASVWQLQPAHNAYFLLTSELGIVGLSLIVIFIVFLIMGLARTAQLWGMAVMASFLPPLFLDHYFWTLASGLWLVGVFLAVVYFYPNLNKKAD
ncbi:MAG: hypothetical protein A2240_02025 [Candidatus Jacksonbacteria bacterium RIFOXYA2_FULL_43_12]|nr:MAG: hypothetical protein A2240_02025 [Candidatus Jacksonbacteria bacterium RIFOXYA2_FULL_43_12]